MTDEQDADDDEAPCTGCGDTGISYQTAAKERIRWLSLRLAEALRDGEKVRELAADLERRAASCCELKSVAADVHDAHRLMGKEAAYLHAAEMVRSALTGEGHG